MKAEGIRSAERVRRVMDKWQGRGAERMDNFCPRNPRQQPGQHGSHNHQWLGVAGRRKLHGGQMGLEFRAGLLGQVKLRFEGFVLRGDGAQVTIQPVDTVRHFPQLGAVGIRHILLVRARTGG